MCIHRYHRLQKKLFFYSLQLKKSAWIPVCNLPQEFILTRGRGREGKGHGKEKNMLLT